MEPATGSIPIEKKLPDQVVYSDERGYYASVLPYGSNVGAPSITSDESRVVLSKYADRANNYFREKYSELHSEYIALMEAFEWNELVYKADIGFEPVVGHIYHLYSRKDGSIFLSLIAPNEWKMKYIGSFKLDILSKWQKIDLNTSK